MLGIIDTQGGGLEAAEGGGGAEAGSGGRVRQAEAEMKKECRLPTAFACHCQLLWFISSETFLRQDRQLRHPCSSCAVLSRGQSLMMMGEIAGLSLWFQIRLGQHICLGLGVTCQFWNALGAWGQIWKCCTSVCGRGVSFWVRGFGLCLSLCSALGSRRALGCEPDVFIGQGCRNLGSCKLVCSVQWVSSVAHRFHCNMPTIKLWL